MTTPNIEELRLLAQTLEFSDAVRCSIQRAADLLQSQAERIKELELDLDVQAGSIEAVQAANSRLAAERDTLRAELAEIAATEPVAYMVQFSPGSRWVELTKEEFDSDLDGHIVYKKQAFFTRPMPAQDVEASMIKLPEPDDTYCGVNYYTEAQLKQAVRDALDALKDVAQTLAWMQHGKCRGFSDGLLTTDEALDKARTALAKYKGAKQ